MKWLRVGGTSLLLSSIAFLILQGCVKSALPVGHYSGSFLWEKRLRDLQLVRRSDRHQFSVANLSEEFRRQIEYLLKQQIASANVSKAQGSFSISVMSGSPLLVQLEQFEIEVPDFSQLRAAIETDNCTKLQAYIEENKNINQRDLPSQRTALFYAAAGGKTRAVQTLLSLGADPNLPDFDGDSPLTAAVVANAAEVVQQLIKAGANPKQANKNGMTPIMRAQQLGRSKLLPLLRPQKLAAGNKAHLPYFSAISLAGGAGGGRVACEKANNPSSEWATGVYFRRTGYF